MHTCTDVCTHYNKGVGPEEGSLGQAQGTTEGYTFLHTNITRGWSSYGESGGHAHTY